MAKAPTISKRVKNQIVESVTLNKITIVVGPTGCGKSTLVPSLLQKELGGRVLCSLPRRLAVVAIAKRVASLRNSSVLGGDSEIGYHVGNHNLSTNATKLLFTTAGILLEELRNNGVDALSKFQCVVIDECHERSPESDLVLALARRFMIKHPKRRIRIVLMSATFDHRRYASYFSDVCPTIDTVNLETAQSFKAFHSQVKTFYLERIPIPPSELALHRGFLNRMRRDPTDDLHFDSGKSLSDDILALIKSLVTHLDEEEPKSAPFLIFCPTYRHLEQLYRTLIKIQNGILTLSILHSAIDIEDCMRSMLSVKKDGNRRHVLLASAIADSSVTVPGVTCVIDLCRSLEVKWNLENRSYDAKTVWCSKSIADQRKGRTGRTCRGRVFRLVPQSFYISRLEPWDVPQLSISSCLNELLSMICTKVNLGDPLEFFRQCLDPPTDEVLKDGIDWLVYMGACRQTIEHAKLFSSRHTEVSPQIVPTRYGAMISAMPMSVADAQLVLEGGRNGLLHETLALVIIMNHRPAPITHHFGSAEANQVLLAEYYMRVESSNKHSVALANLSAYLYWESHWLRQYNKRQLELFESGSAKYGKAWVWTESDDEAHIAWCKEHNLNPSSMRSIKEIIDNTINALYLSQHEPEWLRCSDPNPIWKFKNLQSTDYLEKESISEIYGDKWEFTLCEALTNLALNRPESALPFVRQFFGSKRMQNDSTICKGNTACIHFLMGNCIYGTNCRNIHSFSAPRPLCRFHPNCNKGPTCVYSHGESDGKTPEKDKTTFQPVVTVLKKHSLQSGVYGWFCDHCHKTVLLGEGTFEFSNALMSMDLSPLLATTNDKRDANRAHIKARHLFGVDATKLHRNDELMRALDFEKNEIHFVWNFPFLTNKEEDAAAHELLIRDSFCSAALFLKECNFDDDCYFGLGLQGSQFSRWKVLQSAWATGWRLLAWDRYDYKEFPGYLPRRWGGEAFPAESTRFYVFERVKQERY